MKTYQIAGLITLTLIAAIVVISFFLPSKVRVERSLVIKTSPATVFNQINNLKNWEKWSPWHQVDPAMKINYEGPASGENARYSWTSKDSRVGNGSMVIKESKPYQLIVTEMNFMEEGVSTAGYKFENAPGGVKLTWYMDTEMDNDPIGKYFGLMMNSMIGPDIEKGLEGIKNHVESLPQIEIRQVSLISQELISIKGVCNEAELEGKLAEYYASLSAYASKNKLNPSGSPLTIYHKWSPPDSIELEAALPVVKAFSKAEGKIKKGEIKAGEAVVANYYGNSNGTTAAHMAIEEWVKANNKTISGAPWEVYVTGPAMEKDTTKWLTQVYYPVK